MGNREVPRIAFLSRRTDLDGARAEACSEEEGVEPEAREVPA
jgi:hypothetical protein